MTATASRLGNLTMSTVGTTPATGILKMDAAGLEAAGFQILGTFNATIQFEQSLDNGVTWVAKTVYPFDGGAGVTSATGTGQWKASIGGETHLRARCSAFTSGAPAVTIALTDGQDTGAGALAALLSSTDPVQVYGSNSYMRLLDSGQVKAGAGSFCGFAVGAAGTTISVTVYDSLTASGTVLFGPIVLTAGLDICKSWAFGTGLYVAFSATTGTPNLTVEYR
jgi:hypothetical protein